jgi:hypothetical protein
VVLEVARMWAADFVEGATVGPGDRAIYCHNREGSRFVLYRVAKRVLPKPD